MQHSNKMKKGEEMKGEEKREENERKRSEIVAFLGTYTSPRDPENANIT